MRYTDVLAASLVAPLVAAHGGDIPGAPKLFGMPKNLRARNPWAGHHNVGHAVAHNMLQARQNGNAAGRCGAQGGGASCAPGVCCSSAGYCGQTKDHCAAPDCQINFGPGCDTNKTPYGASTKDDSRRQLGNIAYGGAGIRSCLKPNTVAITYDDGPYIFTEQVMAQFEARGGHATFFITGNNIGKGAIDETESWRSVIQKMDANGHQIASHAWGHENLDKISSSQRVDQMVRNEMALRNILGKYPTYMRPPYSACVTGPCMADMEKLGYVITSFDIDTDDYNQLTREKIQVAKDNFKRGIDAAPRLAIAHDIHELTALNLTSYMLDYVYNAGYTAVTVGECMNDPPANWYRNSAAGPRPSATPSSSVAVPTPTGPTSTNGRCGADNGGQSCIGFLGNEGLSECCSASGWCGRSSDHCGTGCNPASGKCGAQPSVSASKTSAAPVPTASLPTTIDGLCGATAGKTCKGFTINGVKAECCSEYNYCGNTEGHCGATCNPLYGNCGSSAVSSSMAASVSKTSSAQASESASASASKSASASASKSDVKSASSSPVMSASSPPVKSASSTPVVHSSASVSASKSDVKSESKTPVVTMSASSSAPASSTPAVRTSIHSSADKASSSHVVSNGSSLVHKPSETPAMSSSVYSVGHQSSSQVHGDASSTPVHSGASSTPVHGGASSTKVHGDASSTPTHSGASSTPVQGGASSTQVYGDASSTPVYHSASSVPGVPVYGNATPTKATPTTFGTMVKPSSTPCDDDKATPTPTPSAPVSKNGKCGKDNGGQTCAGYKNPFGEIVECCCATSGRCSTDPWACGQGCDPKHGKCPGQSNYGY